MSEALLRNGNFTAENQPEETDAFLTIYRLP
jgi:hypothetical protein